MNSKLQICRGLVVAYLVFLVALNLIDLFSYPAGPTVLAFWIGVSGRSMRLALLALFLWKVFAASRNWILIIGILLGLVAVIIPIHLHMDGKSLVLVAGALTSRNVVAWVFSAAPAVCAVCCFILWIELKKATPNQSPDPTFASGTSRAGHEPRHR